MNPSAAARIDAELERSERELGRLIGLCSLNADVPDDASSATTGRANGSEMDEPHRGIVSEFNRYLFLEMAELSVGVNTSAVSVTRRDYSKSAETDGSEFKWNVELNSSVFSVCVDFCLSYRALIGNLWSSCITYKCRDLMSKDPSIDIPSGVGIGRPVEVGLEMTTDGRPCDNDRMRNMFGLLVSVFSHLQSVLEISRAYDRWQLELRFISLLSIPTSVDIASSIVREPTLGDELSDVKDKIAVIIDRYRRLSVHWKP